MKKSKKVYDERIQAQSNRYTLEAFIAASVLLLLDIVYKTMIQGKGIGEWLDLFLMLVIPWNYYFFRAVIGGIIELPGKKLSKIKLGALSLISIAIISMAALYIMNIAKPFATSESAISTYAGIVTGMAIVAGAVAAAFVISKKVNSKYIE